MSRSGNGYPFTRSRPAGIVCLILWAVVGVGFQLVGLIGWYGRSIVAVVGRIVDRGLCE